jgi:hypothetical protein
MLAEYKAQLSAEYSFFSGLLEGVLARKPAIWNEMRKNHNSDKATDREYEATSDGIDEVGLRLKLKRIEKMISAISSLLRVAEGEAKHIY